METQSNHCRICQFNFKVKFGTLSQAGKSGFISLENFFKVSQKKDLAKNTEQFLLIFVERLVVKN